MKKLWRSCVTGVLHAFLSIWNKTKQCGDNTQLKHCSSRKQAVSVARGPSVPRVEVVCEQRFKAAQLTRSRSSQFNAQPLGHVIDNGASSLPAFAPRRRCRRLPDCGNPAVEGSPPPAVPTINVHVHTLLIQSTK